MKLNKGTKAVIYALLILVAVYFLFPFVYMFFSAFKTEAEINAIPPSLFPKKFLWSNFVNAWQSQESVSSEESAATVFCPAKLYL